MVEPAADVLEGQPCSFTVLESFPSWEHAHNWYHAPDYQKIVQFRKDPCDGWVQFVSAYTFLQQL